MEGYVAPVPDDRVQALGAFPAGSTKESVLASRDTRASGKRSRGTSQAGSNSNAPPKAVCVGPKVCLSQAPFSPVPQPNNNQATVPISDLMSVPVLRDGTRLFATRGDQNRQGFAMTPMRLIQLGIDPREKWLELILERTRTEEGKSQMKNVLTSQDAEKLEQSFMSLWTNKETL